MMNQDRFKGGVCIIGMHRSGTSMIAGLLSGCGLDFGREDKLLGSIESNPRGHYENIDFIGINNALLTYLGGSWYQPPELNPGWERDPGLKPIYDRARGVLESFEGKPTWGWKDPRTTILIPFWKSLIADLKFVICMRSPLEVAMSLLRRNEISQEVAFHLWDRYVRAAVCDTRGDSRMFAFYEDWIMQSSERTNASRLVEFCGLRKPDDLSDFPGAYVTPELRHHATEITELLEAEQVSLEQKLLYIGIRALSGQGVHPDHPGRNREESTSKDINLFLGLLEQFRNEAEMARVQALAGKQQAQLAHLNRELQGLRKQVLQLQGRLSHKEKQIHDLLNTWSWKLTAPLRGCRALYRGKTRDGGGTICGRESAEP